MRAAIFHAPHDIRVEQVPDPVIEQPTDAIVRITHACICGSDLWFYRGVAAGQPGWRIGHEWMGVVEATGPEVRTVKRGDRVLAPFRFSDGTCEYCRTGLPTSCVNVGTWGTVNGGGQAEAIRARLADGTLVVVPPWVDGDDQLLTALLPLTDVMGTGHHAAACAGVRRGGTVAVVGDGAVGLCAVLAARRLGAARIIAVGHHADRLQLARRLGATDIVMGSDEHAVSAVRELTAGGAESVAECVGVKSSMDTAVHIARPGGTVGYVGVPHGSEAIDLWHLFQNNITLRGGVAPVRAYMPELLGDVLAGMLDPSQVLDLTVGLEDLPRGYAAMDARTATKVMVRL